MFQILLSVLFAVHAYAGAYGDRIRELQARHEAAEAQARMAGNLPQQVKLKQQIDIFAQKHNGFRDIGECTSNYLENCTFLAICVPTGTPRYPVASLGTISGTWINRCEVAFGDGSACEFTNDPDWLFAGRKGRGYNHIPKLKASCLDGTGPHETYQF